MLRAGVRSAPAPLRSIDLAQDRDRLLEWRGWYKTARWQRLRWSVLVRDLFTCAMCGRIKGETAELVADHKVPHRGDPELFWDAANIQCLCKGCHDGEKQRRERRARR